MPVAAALSTVGLAALVVSTTGAQQQGSAQQACIVAINKAVRGVVKAQGKNIGACLKDVGNGLLAPGDVETCIAADLDGKVAKARQKTATAFASKCATPPDFGFTGTTAANDAAVLEDLALLQDVFGDPVGDALLQRQNDPIGTRCQQVVQKTYEKILQAQIKTFEGCKKTGLKAGTIDSQSALAACFDAVTTDAKGRIAKLVVKLSRRLATTCANVDLAAAFPGNCSPPNVEGCIAVESLCRACLVIDEADATGVYCDELDNGIADASCVDVRRCGNGVVEPGEACDDGNDTDGDCCSATCTAEPSGQACATDSNLCTDDVCDGSGSCGHPANMAPCDDGNFCNGTDTCSGGTCTHGGDPCASGGECADSCNEATDSCFDPAATACSDDGNSCTGDECDGNGACVHPSAPDTTPCADDGNVCTDDVCDGGACTHTNNTNSCDDGLFCTTTDICSGGTCTGSGDPCTGGAECANVCDEAADSCNVTSGVGCTDDGNLCTDDECDGSGSCGHPNNTASCDDGSFCNGADTCAAGSCSAHAGDPCPGADGDGNCSESCDEDADSCTGADTNGSACTDGLFCNGTDTCAAGSCTTHNGDPCPGADGDGNCSESCNETADNCTAADTNGSACSDGLFCNGADSCASGACTTHVGNPCPGPDGDGNCSESCNETADNCTAADTNGSACNDGQSCNGSDSCSSGSCVGSGVCCGTVDFTFTVNSNNGGLFDSAEWPGGTQSQTSSAGCSVTINNPNNNIDLVCGLASPFSVNTFSGFQNCFGTGGEDGDGCQPVNCPPAGIGSCCSTRPSCSAALNGSGSARYFVRCTDP